LLADVQISLNTNERQLVVYLLSMLQKTSETQDSRNTFSWALFQPCPSKRRHCEIDYRRYRQVPAETVKWKT